MVQMSQMILDDGGSSGNRTELFENAAERALDVYVSNGELIAAAIIAGYSYSRGSATSPNALFGMSSRSITALRRPPRG